MRAHCRLERPSRTPIEQRIGRDVEPGPAILLPECKNVSAERFFTNFRNRAAGRVGEVRDALVVNLDGVAAFVHQAVMVAT